MSEVNDSSPQEQNFSETNESEPTFDSETKIFTYDEGLSGSIKFFST
jgi:hypothetical protein